MRERGFVGDAAVDAFLAAGFTRANVLEVVAIAATKTISNYTNHLTGTPFDAFTRSFPLPPRMSIRSCDTSRPICVQWYLEMVEGTAGFSPRATAAAVACDSALIA